MAVAFALGFFARNTPAWQPYNHMVCCGLETALATTLFPGWGPSHVQSELSAGIRTWTCSSYSLSQCPAGKPHELEWTHMDVAAECVCRMVCQGTCVQL
jgi:hypothetical protein